MSDPWPSSGPSRAAILQAVVEIWNEKKWERIPEVFAEDVAIHEWSGPVPRRGHDTVRAIVNDLHTAFPDFAVHIDQAVEQGEAAAVRWTAAGTLNGSYFGFPATGRAASFTEMLFFRFSSGKVAEVWLLPNVLGSMQDLGLLPAGPPPKPLIFAMRLLSRFRSGPQRT